MVQDHVGGGVMNVSDPPLPHELWKCTHCGTMPQKKMNLKKRLKYVVVPVFHFANWCMEIV